MTSSEQLQKAALQAAKKDLARLNEVLAALGSTNPRRTTKSKTFKPVKPDLSKLGRIATKSQKELEKWKRQVKEKLSDSISPTNKRARNANRQFPHLVSSHLRDSVSSGSYISQSARNNKIRFVMWARITSPHGELTTRGSSRKRRDGKKPKWIGWKEDVLGEKGRGGVTGVRKIFKRLLD